ncbi:MAG: L,D-transpeptidase family protein [Alphaproteobacteria bacterium]|nr:L,D-transpeptidase family protein [Alphaproteobacteria bacterium]
MLIVYPTAPRRGVLQFDDMEFPCALGSAGVRKTKHEGDGATPVGTFQLRRVFYRADRLPEPACQLPVRALTPQDGWCDDPNHGAYNRLVELPFEGSHEVLWREDDLYDVIVVIGHNDDPPHAPLGSAIFLHCATADYSPTQGCVALARDALIDLVPRLSPGMALRVMAAKA